MSQENQSCLRFSLEESLWFRKGQEVEELVSISLDPDITIQENDQYVTIRGSLELTGEYKSVNESSTVEQETDFAQKYVHQVEVREEGIHEFSHRFPVDITIPNNRIQSIYDIDVMVETFDYSIPERSCLKLSADLTISGLYGVRQHESAEGIPSIAANGQLLEREEENNDAEDSAVPFREEAFAEENNPLFFAEARKQQEEDHSKESVNYPTFSYQPEQHTMMTASLFQPSEESEPVRGETTPKAEQKPEIEIEVKKTEIEMIETEDNAAEESSSSSESVSKHEETKKKKMIKKKKSMSLTEFFARKEEVREEKTRLKVCIVQKGDTLEGIAERYDVPFQNLLRVNHLEVNQDVYEGQVLYIPAALAKK